MPYIPEKHRRGIVQAIEPTNTYGELNYRITMACDSFIVQNGLSYNTVNAVVGVLAAIQLRAFPQFDGGDGKLFEEIREFIRDHMRGKVTITGGVIGVLECAKLELYARVVRPYEDVKAMLNGDVYSANILP